MRYPSSLVHVSLLVLTLLFCGATAQNCTALASATLNNSTMNFTCPCPDVFLQVPQITVGKVQMTLENLKTRLSMSARVGNLVVLSSTIDISLGNISLNVSNLTTALDLIVRLDNVREIISTTLNALNQNPSLLSGLLSYTSGLLSSTVNSVGQVVQITVSPTGQIIMNTFDKSTGAISSSVVTGSVLTLPEVGTLTNSLNQTVKLYEYSLNSVVEATFDSSDSIISTKVLQL